MDKGRILIVDDDPIVRDVLYDILNNVGGYQADLAFDGIDGLEKLSRQEYDIVFTDLTMPRMNGMDFLKETIKTVPGVPVVVITGFSSIDNAVNAMREGAKDFITKPFKIETVLGTAAKILGERRLLFKISHNHDNENMVGKLNSELFKSLHEIGILQSISNEIDGIFSNKEIYEKLVEMVSRLFVVREASFGIVENGDLKIEAAIGTTARTISSIGTIFETVISAKTYYMALPGELNPHDNTPLTSPFFSIPLIMNEEVFGILNISHKADGTAFTDYEISLALTFAKKAALRIENNALYEVFYSNLINTLKSLVTSIEARDIYTRNHSERVANYALQVAEVMNFSNDDKEIIRFGGYLHDIGKIGVRDTVLLKPSKLTDDEFREIRLHPVIGDNIIKPIKFFPRERELIRHHHERFDGKGYPDGLAGERIPLVVRIMNVVDTFDAMTTSRPYRTARTHKDAVEELLRCSGTQFDGEIVKAFLQTPAGRGESVGS
ncbi:MAG: response regulator [Nitrospirae bacterium]|nr:response regulator [Nitrospirota bacterium]